MRRLKRGLMTSNERTTLPAYKQIFEAGAPALPVLEQELKNVAFFAEPTRVEGTRLLAGLLALHRDLDEVASDDLIDESLARQCPEILSALLRAARRMTCRDFRTSCFGDIQIWEHTSIDQRYGASTRVQGWLAELQANDIVGIRRIVITPHKPEHDAMGSYMPVLGVVSLAWTTLLPPESYFVCAANASHRFTLFHEVGHHVHKHWFGQDSEQEQDADSYAARTARSSMPFWVRICLPPIGALFKVLGWCETYIPAKRGELPRTRS